jgi:CRP-like cAMP-binding protein
MVATPADVLRVLDEDPDLGAGLDERERPLAEQHLVAAEVRVPRGPWEPDHPLGADPADLGFLVVEGSIIRETELGRHAGAEILGPSDLLRPWEADDGAGSPIPSVSSWRVLEPTRLAVLDGRFTALAGRFPTVIAAVVARALERSRFQALLLAATAMPRLDARLLAVLWHIADRWGRVTPQGTQVGVRLTHEMLAALVGAQRPSVSTAIKNLERAGLVGRDEEGNLLLLGGPPGDAEQAVEALTPG